MKLTLRRYRSRKLSRPGQTNLPPAGPRVPQQDRAFLHRALFGIADREVRHVGGERPVGRRDDRPVDAADGLRLNCNFQTPTSTGTSTSRTCAASSPDWIKMYCAFGSSWAQADDDMNAEQTVTAAKTRSDFRPAFSNMNMR